MRSERPGIWALGGAWIAGVVVGGVLAVALAMAGATKADALMAAMTTPPARNARNLTVELPGRYYFARSLRAIRGFHIAFRVCH
jgi:hypothetical protein